MRIIAAPCSHWKVGARRMSNPFCIPHLSTSGRTIVMQLAPAIEERAYLWHKHVPTSHGWTMEKLNALAQGYRVQPGDISSAGRSGSSVMGENVALARESSRTKLGTLAQRVNCP